jgi:hypothetical protein
VVVTARDDALLSQRLSEAEATACSLRLDLAESGALIKALEDELLSVTSRWRGPDDGRLRGTTVDTIIQVRTLIRRILFQELAAAGGRADVMQDLRVAEVCFRFLLGMRSIQVNKSPLYEHTYGS